LARDDASKIGIFGAGGQAETQLMAACAVRRISRIRVFSPKRESRDRFAQKMTGKLKTAVCATESPREVVEGADIVIAATSSNEPVFEGRWLEPGMHINFVQDREVDSLTLNRAGRVVIDARQRVSDWVMGQKAPRESQGRFDHESFENLSELADVINGTAPGRETRDQITLFRAPGLGIQFASVGKIVYEEARKRGLGRQIPVDWFLEDLHA
jgi:ornithine cyclodeaminase/alanine dehydrogenase-like protein (mu-crystallin family)